MAAKLARLVYRMLRYGMKYLDEERPSTTLNTDDYRSSTSTGKPPRWDYESSKPPQPKGEFLESRSSAEKMSGRKERGLLDS